MSPTDQCGPKQALGVPLWAILATGELRGAPKGGHSSVALGSAGGAEWHVTRGTRRAQTVVKCLGRRYVARVAPNYLGKAAEGAHSRFMVFFVYGTSYFELVANQAWDQHMSLLRMLRLLERGALWSLVS